MIVRLRYFHTLKELAGSEAASLEVPEDATLDDVRRRAGEGNPALAAALSKAMIAQNKEYASGDEAALPGAEIAFMPPVSGG